MKEGVAPPPQPPPVNGEQTAEGDSQPQPAV
jgi:hypothetical protein